MEITLGHIYRWHATTEGTRVEDEGEILEVYEKFYLDLLQTPRPEN